MGGSFNIRCKTCNYERSFTTGIGMMYSPFNLLDKHSDLLPSLIRSKKVVLHIRSLVEEQQAQLEDYGHEVYRCLNCFKFYNRFHIKLTVPDGSYETDYKCSTCKCLLNKLILDQENVLAGLPCPQCQSTTLEENDGGLLWD